MDPDDHGGGRADHCDTIPVIMIRIGNLVCKGSVMARTSLGVKDILKKTRILRTKAKGTKGRLTQREKAKLASCLAFLSGSAMSRVRSFNFIMRFCLLAYFKTLEYL